MDITHDNVCSSMLSCFYSHLLSTGRPISSFFLPSVMSVIQLKWRGVGKIYNRLKVNTHSCIYRFTAEYTQTFFVFLLVYIIEAQISHWWRGSVREVPFLKIRSDRVKNLITSLYVCLGAIIERTNKIIFLIYPLLT